MEPKEISVSDQEKNLYFIKTSKLRATMRETDSGYIVTKGSEARSSYTTSYASYWIKMRDKLINNGTLKQENGKLIFAQDAVFTSVSTATAIVLGRVSNGHIDWIDQHGRTYEGNAELI